MSNAQASSENFDELTGMLSYAGLALLAEQMISRSEREREMISLACLRVVLTDSLDDEAGVAARNVSLLELSRLLRSELRSSDVVARVSTSELAALLPNTGADQARRLIEELSFVVSREQSIASFSTMAEIGIATFDPSERRCDLNALLDEAHLAISFSNLGWR